MLFISRAWAGSCLDPKTVDGYPRCVINTLIDEPHRAGKTAVVISAQLPHVKMMPEPVLD